MSTKTPLLPVELPPFHLIPLISPIFTLTSPSTFNQSLPSTPTKSALSTPISSSLSTSPPSSLNRLSQLVSSSVATTPNLNDVNNSNKNNNNKIPVVRTVESSEDLIWVGGSDGRMRIYEIGMSNNNNLNDRRMSSFGFGLDYSTPLSRRGSEISSNSETPSTPLPVTGLDLIQEVTVTQGRKPADRIALLEPLQKAVILSEGVLTFHSLPNLTPLPVNLFPPMKGVTTFSLDEDELELFAAFSTGSGNNGSKSSNITSMHICAIKRKTMHILLVTSEGVSSIKELSLKGGALLSVFRRNIVCIADTLNYSIVDIEAAIATPLLPISQSPNEDARPLSTSTSTSDLSSSTTPPTTATTIPIDPRQRPAVACIGKNEFLIASHTGSTTLGVFINELGEPCRGTLEWGSNLRSLTIDHPYVVALLYNNTIEIHSSITLEIVQVIPLPINSNPNSPYSLQPRSLIHSWSGLNLTSRNNASGEGVNNKIDLVLVNLLNDTNNVIGKSNFNSINQMTTPTKSNQNRRKSEVAEAQNQKKKNQIKARTLVIGKNSLLALAPWTLVAQADALFDKGRGEDAIALAKQIEGADTSGIKNPEVSYIYLKAAYNSLRATLFQEAFQYFLNSECDPRLVIRMFSNLNSFTLMNSEEKLEVFDGLRYEVEDSLSIDDFIMDNLTHNYSPHMKPNVESASPTKGLRTALGTTARDCLRIYLTKWRIARRSNQNNSNSSSNGDSRKVDMVVDTTLVQLLAEESMECEILKLLDVKNDCVLQLVEPSLLEFGLYQLQASIFLKRGEVSKALDIWTKIVEGEFVDEKYTGGSEYIFELLWQSNDKDLVENFGIWLVRNDRDLGIKLFTDPRQTHTFDTRSLFAKLRKYDSDAADLYLESAVLQKRDTDSRLHSDLVQRFVDRLGELLVDPATKLHVREQESEYINLVSSSSTHQVPTFLSFISGRFDSNSIHATFDSARLKTILFLSTSSNYDILAIKKSFEDMESKGLRGLTLERAIVYGKLKLDRQALSLLLYTLQDLTTSETYCHQSGDLTLSADISKVAALLSLSIPTPKKRSHIKKEGEEQRRVELARLLVEMCLNGSGTEADQSSSAINMEQVGKILEAQSANLDTLAIIPLLPSNSPVSIFQSFLTHSLRRSLHSRHETSLLKALALSQNFEISDKLGDLQVKLGGTLQNSGPILGVDGKEESDKLMEKLDELEKGEKNEVVDIEVD